MKNNNNSIGISVILTMILVTVLVMVLSSCGTYNLTERQTKIDYELDKLYLDYSYQRDSLIIEFYKK
tara:strand:+ start:1769 stop:1969 length:201 start_codon:yes stop_codon:yes gene_type:complete